MRVFILYILSFCLKIRRLAYLKCWLHFYCSCKFMSIMIHFICSWIWLIIWLIRNLLLNRRSTHEICPHSNNPHPYRSVPARQINLSSDLNVWRPRCALHRGRFVFCIIKRPLVHRIGGRFDWGTTAYLPRSTRRTRRRHKEQQEKLLVFLCFSSWALCASW